MRLGYCSSLCTLCGNFLTKENNSREHLIPSAIGGRKKIKGFICKSCNNRTGAAWDAPLANTFQKFSLFIGIRRDKGITPFAKIETMGGKSHCLHSDGTRTLTKPQYNLTRTENGVEVSIQASSKEDLSNLRKRLEKENDLSKADISKLFDGVEFTQTYSDDPALIDLQVNLDLCGQSLVKSVLALAHDSEVEPASFEQALYHLKNADAASIVGFYYHDDLVVNRPEDQIFHCIAVQGNPETKQLIGYVEYFRCLRVLVCLSNQYEGGKFSNSYAINPVSGHTLSIEVNLNLSRQEVAAALNGERLSMAVMSKAKEEARIIGEKLGIDREIKRVSEEAIHFAFKECGVRYGESLMPDDYSRFSRALQEHINPPLNQIAVRQPEICGKWN